MERPTRLVSSLAFLDHGRTEHPEKCERLEQILNIFKQYQGSSQLRLDLDCVRLASKQELQQIHSAAYVDSIFSLEGKTGEVDHETPLSEGSVKAARLAVGLGLGLVEDVLEGKTSNGFLLARPPGHHATPQQGMGFCVFNTIALMATRALELGLERVLILDWDVHHGNGTQAAFYEDNRVLFIDLHQDDLFPNSSGRASERGSGRGFGCTMNIPLPHSCRDADYLRVLSRWVKQRVFDFKPELILVSAGFDAHISDPLGSMSLTTEGYRQMTRLLKSWANELCQGRLILNLEGGYEPEALSQNVLACAEELVSSQSLAVELGGEVREDLEEWMVGLCL